MRTIIIDSQTIYEFKRMIGFMDNCDYLFDFARLRANLEAIYGNDIQLVYFYRLNEFVQPNNYIVGALETNDFKIYLSRANVSSPEDDLEECIHSYTDVLVVTKDMYMKEVVRDCDAQLIAVSCILWDCLVMLRNFGSYNPEVSYASISDVVADAVHTTV